MKSTIITIISFLSGLLGAYLALHIFVMLLLRVEFFVHVPWMSWPRAIFVTENWFFLSGFFLYGSFAVQGLAPLSERRRNILSWLTLVFALFHIEAICMTLGEEVHVINRWKVWFHISCIGLLSFYFLLLAKASRIRLFLFLSSLFFVFSIAASASYHVFLTSRSPLASSAWELVKSEREDSFSGNSFEPFDDLVKRRHPPLLMFGELPFFYMLYPCNDTMSSLEYGAYYVGIAKDDITIVSSGYLSENLKGSESCADTRIRAWVSSLGRMSHFSLEAEDVLVLEASNGERLHFKKASEETLKLRPADGRGLPGWEKKVLRKVMYWNTSYEALFYNQR